MFLEKLIQNCVKFIHKFIYIQFCITVVVLNNKYVTNMKTAISHRLIIDNIITNSPHSPYYVTRTSANDSAVSLSHDTDENHVTSIFDTV